MTFPDPDDIARTRLRLTQCEVTWFAFAVAALLLLAIDDLGWWTALVLGAAVTLAVVSKPTRRISVAVDRRDIVAVGLLYGLVVAALRVAFTVFTTDNVLGLFLCFGAALFVGVAGPVVYQVWMRGRDLRSLGLGLHRLRETVLAALVLAGAQFLILFQGFELPEPQDWLPLLVMSLVVGFFEAVFFRGFIQNLLEKSLGTTPAVAGAAFLYSLYHVGYGMPLHELWFLMGLGVVYAVAFRITRNVIVLWPLLTPVGAFFNNLTGGDIALPWASIAGFADVLALMAGVIWLGRRRLRGHVGELEVDPTELPSRLEAPAPAPPRR